jgi:hypothetical protein
MFMLDFYPVEIIADNILFYSIQKFVTKHNPPTFSDT